MCLMIFEPLSGFPMSDIEYLIESDRRTASDKLYITQLLPTRYSINVTNAFSGYQYNKQWMYVYGEDFQQNIHLVYEWVRQIADQILIQCMQDSAGLLTGYSFGVCRGQVDYWPDIHSAYGIGQAVMDIVYTTHILLINFITTRTFDMESLYHSTYFLTYPSQTVFYLLKT